MKILIVANLSMLGNPFVSTISSRLIEKGVDVVCSQKEFWENPFIYDVIHFQWPEIIFNWKKNISDHELESLTANLEIIKKAGVPMCITVHNLKPHTSNNPNLIKAFDSIYTHCAGFFHMGEYSKDLFEKEYPRAIHFIIPHHIYDSIYRFNMSFEPHRWIEKGKVNLLSFGAFRNNEERNLVLSLMRDPHFKNVNFIVPGFCNSPCKTIVEKIKVRLCRLYYMCAGINFTSRFLTDKETEQLFIQSDIVLLQRLSILNSGNLPMAFAAGKVVVGPNVGNVGAILNETGNPTFDPSNRESIINSILNAIALSKSELGSGNKVYAQRCWSSSHIATLIKEAYCELFEKREQD